MWKSIVIIAMRTSAMLVICIVVAVSVSATGSSNLYDQGMEAFRKGNYGSAEILLRKARDAGEKEYLDSAWFYLARSMLARGRYRSALFEFRGLLTQCKTEDIAIESRYWMAESHYHMSDYSAAIEEYRRYIEGSRDGALGPAAHERIGDIYSSQKRHEEAVIEWESALSGGVAGNMKSQLQYRIGLALYNSGRYEEAARKLEKFVEISTDADGVKTIMLLGRIYRETGEHLKAVRIYGAIPPSLITEPPFRDAMYYHALSLIELGRKEDAETLLRDYIRRGDKSRRYSEARCELGKLLVEGERSEEGLRILEGVRTGSSKKSIRSRAMKLLGAYYIEKNSPKAIVYLEESLIAAPKEERRDLLLSLGKAYFRTGLYERAAVTFSLHAKENPFDAAHGEVRFLLARAYLEGGDFTRASDLFEAIGRDDPFSPFSHESRYYLALTRSRRGDAAGAVPLLNDYLRGKNIENAYDANLLLLRIQLGLDDLEGAGKTAETLIRHFLEKAGVEAAIFEYAAALIGKGRNSKRYASILFSRFSGSEPAADLNVLLGNDYFDQGRYVPALEHYNMYLDTPHLKYRGTVFYRKLLALYRLERDEELTAIIARGEYPPMNGKESAEVPLLLARSYSRLKMYDKAYMAIDASRLAHYPAEDVLSYVNSSLRVGDVPSAIRASVFLEGKGEMHSQSLYMIGDYFMKRGKREKSEHYFTMVAAEYPGTAYGSHAKLSLGEVRLLLGEWQRAVNLIEGVEASPGSDLFNRKKSLIIQCYFKMGKEKEALALVQSAQRDLVAGEYGEPVMKLAMEYHYRKKDLQQFTRYASLLAGYPGNGDLINYLSGKLYAQTGNHSKAYLYFKELAGVGGRYRDESFYYLGLHEMLVNGNTEKALTYFSGIIEMPNAGKSLKLKALLNMALIYRDEKEDGKARDCLIRVKSATRRGLVHIQALNLLDVFGYQAP